MTYNQVFEKTEYKVAELKTDNRHVQKYWEKLSESGLGKIAPEEHEWMVFI